MRIIISNSSRWSKSRSAPQPGVLLNTQLVFNVGFYAVVPFIALTLSNDFGLAGAAVGLVLGIRTFSQQGAFLIGGLLADRFGAKGLILVGCAVRAVGFATLSAALWPKTSLLPLFVLGTVLTGFGGALFSPALSTLVAAADGQRRGRRPTLFAWLTVFGETGAAVGPLVGAVLLHWGFAATALVGAALFIAVGIALALVLPDTPQPDSTVVRPRRLTAHALRDRRFIAFAAVHAVDLFAYNQLYLAMPTELKRSGAGAGQLAVLFTWVSVLTISLQIPVARWASRRSPQSVLRLGYASHAAGFMIVAFAAVGQVPSMPSLAPAITSVTLLTLGHLLAAPTAMLAVSHFAKQHPTGSYFGLLATAGGVLVLVGNVGVGSLLGSAGVTGAAAALPWLCMAVMPLVAAWLIRAPWLWAVPESMAPSSREPVTAAAL